MKFSAFVPVKNKGLISTPVNNILNKPSYFTNYIQSVKDSGLFENIIIGVFSKELISPITNITNEFNFLKVADLSEINEIPEYDRIIEGRKWSYENWEGGLSYYSYFDEDFNPYALLKILTETNSDFIATLSLNSVFFDKSLTTDIIASLKNTNIPPPFKISHTQPGFNIPFYGKEILTKLAENNAGFYNTLRPLINLSRPNIEVQSFFYHAPVNLISKPKRFLNDISNSRELIDKLFENGCSNNSSLKDVMHTINKQPEIIDTSLPSDIEIELTTESMNPNEFPKKFKRKNKFMPLDLINKIFSELPDNKNIRIIFNGYGDPMLHPQIKEILDLISEQNLFSVHIQTNGIFEQDLINNLINSKVSSVSFNVNWPNRDLYRDNCGIDEYDRIMRNISSFVELREKCENRLPFLVIEAEKTIDFDKVQDEFVKYWFVRSDKVVIRQHKDYAGQIKFNGWIKLNPGRRFACKRAISTMRILSDGTVTTCSEDVIPKVSFGSVIKSTIGELWNSKKLKKFRNAQLSENFLNSPICRKCHSWAEY